MSDLNQDTPSGDSPETESVVEQTLRAQRDYWREIAERVSGISSRELPFDPPKRIILFGVGSSHFAARLAAFSLIRDKSRNRFPVVACSSLSLGSEILPTKGDWAIALSHRGKSDATVRAMDLCDRSGAFTILACAQGAEAPACARYVLPTVPLEKVEPHTAAVTGAICAVTSLLMGPRAIEEWDAIRSIGNPDLATLRRRAGTGPAVILGEWEGEWLAREGALKLMEMAGVKVRAFGTEEFFHGPHFSVDPETDPLWYISAKNDPRASQIRRADHTIGIYGASPLAWVPALVELQWLALAVALNRGMNPDEPKSRWLV